jgi:hypothetical protein
MRTPAPQPLTLMRSRLSPDHTRGFFFLDWTSIAAGKKRPREPWRGHTGPKDCYGRRKCPINSPALRLRPPYWLSKRGEHSAGLSQFAFIGEGANAY